MNAKETSRPLVAQGAGQTETAAMRAAISCNYFTMNRQQRQSGFISRLLLYGTENGQTLRAVERGAGLD